MTRFLPKYQEFTSLNLTAELVQEGDKLIAAVTLSVRARIDGGGPKPMYRQMRIGLDSMLADLRAQMSESQDPEAPQQGGVE